MKVMKVTFMLCVTGVLGLSASMAMATVYGPEIMVNGDLEDSPLGTGWSSWGSAMVADDAAHNNVIFGNSLDTGAQQSLSLYPGVEYLLLFEKKDLLLGPTGRAGLGLSGASVTYANPGVTVTGDSILWGAPGDIDLWLGQVLVVKPDTSTVTIVAGGADEGLTRYDKFSIREIDPGAVSFGPELMTNGDFEADPHDTGWGAWGTDPILDDGTGNWVGYGDGVGIGGYQPLTGLTVDSQYLLTFDKKDLTAGGTGKSGTAIYEVSDWTLVSSNDPTLYQSASEAIWDAHLDTWEHIEIVLVANSTTIGPGFTGSYGGSSLFDNYSFRQIINPEPATLGLLSLGGLLALLRRPRRAYLIDHQ